MYVVARSHATRGYTRGRSLLVACGLRLASEEGGNAAAAGRVLLAPRGFGAVSLDATC